MWPREINKVFKDKILDEAVHSEIVGEKNAVKKEILNKIDKVMTAHMLKEQQLSQPLDQSGTGTQTSLFSQKVRQAGRILKSALGSVSKKYPELTYGLAALLIVTTITK